MLTLRKSEDRGHFDYGWLETYHTFSFSDYRDVAHMGYHALRVIDEDRVAPGEGFPTHPHRDMEILTYVLDGALEHRDSMGNGSVIRPGDVQRMSAGTGVTHSETNASSTEGVHFLQIWILPQQRGLTPGYEQKYYSDADKLGSWRLVASSDGREGSVTVHQDVDVYATRLTAGQSLAFSLRKGRHAWIQVVRGSIRVQGADVRQSDGVSLDGERSVTVEASNDAELLLFDLA